MFFGPVVEHWMRSYPKKSSFIQNYPENLEAVNVVPILIGVNEFDGVTLDWAGS